MKKLILLIGLCSLFHRIKRVQVLKRGYAARLQQRYGMELDMAKLSIHGFQTFLISGLRIQTKGIILTADTLKLRFNIFTVLRKRKMATAVVHMGIVMVQPISGNPAKPLKPSAAEIPVNLIQVLERKWYAAYKRLRNFLWTDISWQLHVKECRVAMPRYEAALIVRELHYSIPSFSLEAICIYRNRQQACKLEGSIDPVARTIKTIVTAMPSEEHPVLSFERFTCSFAEMQATDDGQYITQLNCDMQGIAIDHRRIAQQTITLPSAGFEMHCRFSKQAFMISEESCGHIDEMPFSFLFSHDESEPDRVKCIVMGELEATRLSSFFSHALLKQLVASGSFTVRARMIYTISNPFEYFFDLSILDNSLVIHDFNEFDLHYLNHPFYHTVYKEGAYLRSIHLDKNSNPDYCGEEKLPHKLPAIIVYSEDPRFYEHAGIDEFFIGYAIATNINAKKLARGASTITMQLVRNLFLNHEKNFLRKLEEVVITLLLENYFEVPKQRLLTLYLNIIEFGPGVYGVGEAAGFYFNRQAAALTIPECIILTYIIPRPIHFFNALVARSQQLERNLLNHLKGRSENLLRAGIITEEEYASFEMESISHLNIWDYFNEGQWRAAVK